LYYINKYNKLNNINKFKFIYIKKLIKF
jgi:hypothetical protein